MLVINLISNHEKGNDFSLFGDTDSFELLRRKEPKRTRGAPFNTGKLQFVKTTLAVYKDLGDGQALNI